VSDDIARLLSQATMEASILKSYAKAGPMGRMWQRILLEAKSDDLSRLFKQA